MDRNLVMEFARVTEAAAINCAHWIGKGEKNLADGAAVEAMRKMFDTVAINGTVVIGEGEMDEAPMLYIGEKVGCGGPAVDIAVDPLEGTNLTAKNMNGAIAVMAVAEAGGLLHAPDMYMDKIVVGPKAKGAIDLNKSPKENMINVAKALGKDTSEMTIVLLDRERHKHIVEAARSLCVRCKFITDGDVSPVIATSFGTEGIDMMMGIGGAPEGVIAAAAIKCMGGDMQGRLVPENEEEVKRVHDMGIEDINKVLMLEDLVPAEDPIFVATGVTNGDMLRGIRFTEKHAITHTVIMRGLTGTVRFVEAYHDYERKPKYIKIK
ncbi:MAG: class II fructose-bisphosphatase [Peptococcaceae bacterium]|nr:class II fructose-bisphosphatase [Peptococcaceae bacterium]